MFTLRSPKVNTFRIKLYRAILYNFNCKIYIRNFVQHLRKIPFSLDALPILNQTIFSLDALPILNQTIQIGS